MTSEDVQSDDSQTLATRRDWLSMSAAVGSAALLSNVSAERVLAQSGGPSDEISGTVEDSGGAVEGATVVAVPHDESLAALVTTTNASGEYVFEQSDLHEDSNLYHVIARDGTETDPRRAQQQYPFIAAEGPPSIPDSGGTHQWNGDDGSGSTITDTIGSLDGAINGPTWQTGDGAGDAYLSYDGIDDYVDLGSASRSAFTHFTELGEGTVFAWINPGDVASNRAIIGSAFSSSDVGFAFRIEDGSTSGDMRFSIRDGSGDSSVNAIATDVITTGGWVPVACTADGTDVKMFVGESMAEEATASWTLSGSSNDFDNNVTIGAWAGGAEDRFDGGIDLVWSDSVAQSQSDLQSFVDDSKEFYS